MPSTISKAVRLHVDRLTFDPRVNRSVRDAWVKYLASEFDLELAEPITVSERADGSLVVLAGQHRVLGMRKAIDDGRINGDGKIACKVYHDLTVAEEAAKAKYDHRHRSLGKVAEFKLDVTAKDPDAVAINKIVQGAGCRIEEQARTDGRTIRATSALRKVYGGADLTTVAQNPIVLKATLQTILNAWEPTPQSWHAAIIEGVGRVFLRYRSKIDVDRLERTLAGSHGGAIGLEMRARTLRELQGGKLAVAVGGVIVEAYNKGLRGAKRLDGWWD
jgi:hypothetical protein